ncbi:Cytosine-5 DNA methyltransferase [Metamycoplasma auris 15026]|uniref:Cytosine-specific methyltransferase n=1 Tax=Metamycoplasma auris 15026 TaxID=1188233 RepID=N9VBG2_9BACT|nr:DNA (cytosine-5-)-methyltransferase [Metamycoplasma auris]ENY69033.1 Cytosine-5 DNA methyltransferase [Metamycoplasma auris 15026]
MSKINVLEAFSGIGAQHKAISNLKKKQKIKVFNIVAIADWDARANIAYSTIHSNLLSKQNQILNRRNLIDENKINKFLEKFDFSLNSKSISKITRKDLEFKKLLAASVLLDNNQVDINNLDPKIIRKLKIDLITYSFPCQGLSIANMGRAKGINNEQSKSNLVWQIYRILNEASYKPKYLLMENVPNLLSNKFKAEYEHWKNKLSDLGYKTFTIILNSIDCGSIQHRRRVFAISTLKELEIPFNNDIEFKNYIDKITSNKKLSLDKKRKKFNDIFKKFPCNEENLSCLINHTPSRIKMIESVKIINESKNFEIPTLTTKQDRIPNVGIIKLKNDYTNKTNYRFISPREAYRLMGFNDEDFNKLIPLIEKRILNKESLYRQAGNSISVEAIEVIFQVISEIEINNNPNENLKEVE